MSGDIHLHAEKGAKQLLNPESLEEQEAKVSDAFPIDLLSQLRKKEGHFGKPFAPTMHDTASEKELEIESRNPKI